MWPALHIPIHDTYTYVHKTPIPTHDTYTYTRHLYLYTTPIPLHDTYTYTRHLGGQTTSFCENISLMIDRGKGDNYPKIIAIETEAIIS